MGYKSKSVLLIDKAYQPIMFVSRKKALRQVYVGKAIFLMDEQVIRLVHATINIDRIYSKGKCSLGTRYSIFLRDGYICQYCNKKLGKKEQTLDHIIPKASGGLTSFWNCVAACRKCNQKKGSKTLKKANMKLQRKPYQPSYRELLLAMDNEKIWSRFCNWIKTATTEEQQW